jgi:hypothetical protein
MCSATCKEENLAATLHVKKALIGVTRPGFALCCFNSYWAEYHRAQSQHRYAIAALY